MRGLRGASLAIGVAVTIVLGMAGSAIGQSDAVGEEEKLTLHVGSIEDIVSVNVFKACCTSDYEMMLMNYNMLLGFGAEDLTPVPELATEPCEASPDSMT